MKSTIKIKVLICILAERHTLRWLGSPEYHKNWAAWWARDFEAAGYWDSRLQAWACGRWFDWCGRTELPIPDVLDVWDIQNFACRHLCLLLHIV